MTLTERIEATGAFLFRYRSQIPALTLVFFFFLLRYQAGAPDFAGFSVQWSLGCLVISLLGFAVRFVTLGYTPEGTSGRNRSRQVAEVLNTTGVYSLLRHPLYLGNFGIFLGISLYPRSAWVLVLGIALFWAFYIPIIVTEDRFLRGKFGEAHAAWASQTFAVLPNPLHWRPSDRPWVLRTSIRREYQSFFAIIAYYSLLEAMAFYHTQGSLGLHPVYAWLLGLSVIAYGMLRYVIKRTELLSPPAA